MTPFIPSLSYEEQQGLRSEYQNQGSSSNAPYYATSDQYQDEYTGGGTATSAGAPVAAGATSYYGHAAYGQTTSEYTYQAPEQEYQPPAAQTALGSSLLGGMAIGTSPVPAVAPPPYHSYQQQL
jgi:hypothetical protein